MQIKRFALTILPTMIEDNKVVVLYGPRRVGKTTLLKDFLHTRSDQHNTLLLNGETRAVQDALSQRSVKALSTLFGRKKLIVIDEAQYVPAIGLCLKLAVDHLPGIQIIASGSASFSLAQQVGEPLTGRKKTLTVYPIWIREMLKTSNVPTYQESLEEYLLYGLYPETLTRPTAADKVAYLHDLLDSYLLKDLLALEHVRNSKKLRDLLTLLAFQIGHEVSLSELGTSLELHKDTIFHYLDLLEQAFVIINVRGFSRNLRKEVTRTSRYYFYDNGIRNALINNFNPVSRRDDVGMLWENYLIMERRKKQAYTRLFANNYFWRTYDQQELDHVEEYGGKLHGYEMTWGGRKKRPPRDWLAVYPNASYDLLTRETHLDFIA